MEAGLDNYLHSISIDLSGKLVFEKLVSNGIIKT